MYLFSVKISSVSFLSPRGKFDVEIRAESIKLCSKSTNIGVFWKNVEDLYLLPVPVPKSSNFPRNIPDTVHAAWIPKSQMLGAWNYLERTSCERKIAGSNFQFMFKITFSLTACFCQLRYIVLQSKETDKAQAVVCEDWAKDKLSGPEMQLSSNPHDLISSIIHKVSDRPVLVRKISFCVCTSFALLVL